MPPAPGLNPGEPGSLFDAGGKLWGHHPEGWIYKNDVFTSENWSQEKKDHFLSKEKFNNCDPQNPNDSVATTIRSSVGQAAGAPHDLLVRNNCPGIMWGLI